MTNIQSNHTVKPRWFLLGGIGLASVFLALCTTELVARRLFTETNPEVNTCVVSDPVTQEVQGKPNSVCKLKTLESNWVEYRYNDRGHRSDTNYSPKPAGTYRIVIIGSSLAEGWTVPLHQSFSGLLPGILSKETSRPVDVYNEGVERGSVSNTDMRFNQALAADPDMILWPLTPWDILHTDTSPAIGALRGEKTATSATKQKTWQRLWANVTRKRDLVAGLRDHLRSFFMLQHYRYESPSIYLAHTIATPDEYTPSLQPHPSGAWADKLQILDRDTADMAARARAAGVPFVVMALPRHAQAVMIASGDWPADLNPYSFGDQVKAIVTKNGGIYVDILHDFQSEPEVSSDFYPVDQHLNLAGQALFARIMAKELTNGSIPALAANSTHDIFGGGKR